MPAISPTQSNVQAALAAFLASVTGLEIGATIISGQNNRAPEPAGTTFVVMTPIRFERIETNVDAYSDVRFTGSIAGSVLTVSAVSFGTIKAGAALFGVTVAANTTVVSQSSGAAGGVGTYVISPSQSAASQVMATGAKTMQQAAIVTVQLDFHSADLTAGDLAQAFSTALRDEYGVSFFAGLDPPLDGVVPLYADDPQQRPFLNAEQQYEWRWVLEARFQVNQQVSVPQQYADSVGLTLVDVDAVYPP